MQVLVVWLSDQFSFKIVWQGLDNMDNFLENRIIKEDMDNLLYRQENCSWLKDKTVLITGAYGMLASYLVFFLIYLNEVDSNNNVKIIAQGRNMEKMRQRFGLYCNKKYFEILQEDICNPSILENERDIDYIIHTASLASPQFYGTRPVDVILPNSIGTYYLLQLAKEKNVSGFLFFSSGDVYGKLPYRKEKYLETDYGYLDCMDNRSCYGESKRIGENLCRAFFTQYGVPTKVVRIAHTYGPTLDLVNDQRMFSEFVNCIVQSKDIEMKSDGTAERMLCYIVDATDAFLKILDKVKYGEAYNMFNNTQMISVKELAKLVVEMFPEKNLNVVMKQRERSSEYLESPVHKSPVMSTEKLQQLGWYPIFDIYSGFKRTILSFESD